MKKHNFCAGPCILPQTVFEKASQSVKDFDGSGLSILEISHRSNVFQQILKETRALIKELMGLNNEYEVLLLQGGASLQFTMVPFNLAKNNESPLYLDTGRWANNAFLEAEKICKPKIIASSKDRNYNYIPKDYNIPEDTPYFHCTSNNTIYGTQMKVFPTTKVPLVSDMSSDILSRKINYSQFDLIYAGAQKNIGAAGVTVVIVRKSILEKSLERNIPSYLDYNVHITKNSCFNTSPVFSIYTAYLNLLWLKAQGGVGVMDERNKKKAETLYAEIDNNDLFEGVATKEDRSNMNVTFRLKELSLEEKFAEICDEAGVVAIKGHRTVGGYRASLYNALELESVEVLVACMKRLNEIA